jgi:hypothetical protein
VTAASATLPSEVLPPSLGSRELQRGWATQDREGARITVLLLTRADEVTE